MNTKKLIEMYIKQMNPQEKIAYDIAVKNLESSFDIEKSIGFNEFIKNNLLFSLFPYFLVYQNLLTYHFFQIVLFSLILPIYLLQFLHCL